MSLNIAEKQAVVAEVSEIITDAQAALLAEYRGLTVAEMMALRTEARNAGVYVRIIKNTLTRRAVRETEFECLTDHLVGPLAFAVSEDPIAVAKVFDNFSRSHDKFIVKVGAMNGALMSEDEIRALAKLPGREELLATLLATLQAPAQKFVQTLNEVPGKFVRTLSAVHDSKEAA